MQTTDADICQRNGYTEEKTQKTVPPIVTHIDMPRYKLDQYVRDLYHFVCGLKDLKLANKETMVSFTPVVSSYCSPVPGLHQHQSIKYLELLKH